MSKRKLFISAGHSNTKGRDRGAVGNGYVEGNVTVEFRDLLVNQLKIHGADVTVDKNDSVSGETVSFIRGLIQKKLFSVNGILVDIHFNASSNTSATGAEVIIPDAPSTFEKELAKDLANEIADCLGVKNRGVKTELQSARKQLVWMRTTGENVLLELCFISNASDMEKYQENKEKLAIRLARLLTDWSNY